MEVIDVSNFKKYNYKNSYNLDYIEYRRYKMLKKEKEFVSENHTDVDSEKPKERCLDCGLF